MFVPQELCPGAKPGFPLHGCQWGQVSVTVSLVIPALGCMECCSPFLLEVFGQLKVLLWTPMGKKSPDRQVPPCWLHPSSGREVDEAMEQFSCFLLSPPWNYHGFRI